MAVREVLESFRKGEIDESQAERMLRMDYIDSIEGDVLFDSSRQNRKGVPEIVYAKTKTSETAAEIASKKYPSLTIFSKVSEEQYEAIKETVPTAEYIRKANMVIIGKMPECDKGVIGIITAGTSDVPIAEEARVIAESMGVRCMTFYDIGVAGIHRLLGPIKQMIAADVSAIVAVAGMEGALPTVVSSLSPVPVIGVPTSTGYGAGGDGIAALLSMLQSCSPGLTAVNIDNGVGAGATAALIALGRNRQ